METKLIAYEDQGTSLEAFSAFEKSNKPRPGIILCHAWRGRDEFVCKKAEELASWGYVTFALDMYGKGVLGKNEMENNALMAPFMKDRLLLQRRMLAGLEAFKKQPELDAKHIGVMGFCFGGLCALDLARSGADIQASVSVHGLLDSPKGISNKEIKAKVLALHGYEDPMVPPEKVIAFADEMTKSEVDWQIHIYGNTMHAFTNPQADDPKSGKSYNKLSDKRAWREMKDFFNETLKM